MFGYGLVSRGAGRTVVSAPLVVTVVGLTLGALARGNGANIATVERDDVLLLGEFALATILFIGASRFDVRALFEGSGIALHLLGLAMPLTVPRPAGRGRTR